jgi:hypothetical protein
MPLYTVCRLESAVAFTLRSAEPGVLNRIAAALLGGKFATQAYLMPASAASAAALSVFSQLNPARPK